MEKMTLPSSGIPSSFLVRRQQQRHENFLLSKARKPKLPISISPVSRNPKTPCFSSVTSATQQQQSSSSSSSSNLENATSESQQQQQPEQEANPNKTRLIAQNVPWTSTSDDIRRLFQNYGTVTDVELSMYNKTKNRGLAFVTMGSEEEAIAALNNLDSYELEGRVIKVEFARSLKNQSSSVMPDPVKKFDIFVGNLAWRVRSSDLREFFGAENGSIVRVQVVFQTNPRRSAGYGFVSFRSREEADAAIAAFNGKKLMGRPIRLGLSKKDIGVTGEDSNESSQFRGETAELSNDESLANLVDHKDQEAAKQAK